MERFGPDQRAGERRPAYSSPPVTLNDTDETAIDAMWRVNVKGPLRMIRAALPHAGVGARGG
jgi:NAD(P)-dependent dehydrogenase (short-subunit alcohol dehydrogenase family)